jgi:hypothetical protein
MHLLTESSPQNLGDGAILLDTETGVVCSARFAMKWTDANKKAVWAAGLEAKKLEAKYSAGYSPPPPLPPTPIFDLSTAQPPLPHDARFDLMTAEYNYNQLVRKADDEKVPDPDSSYFQSFPLCKKYTLRLPGGQDDLLPKNSSVPTLCEQNQLVVGNRLNFVAHRLCK